VPVKVPVNRNPQRTVTPKQEPPVERKPERQTISMQVREQLLTISSQQIFIIGCGLSPPPVPVGAAKAGRNTPHLPTRLGED